MLNTITLTHIPQKFGWVECDKRISRDYRILRTIGRYFFSSTRWLRQVWQRLDIHNYISAWQLWMKSLVNSHVNIKLLSISKILMTFYLRGILRRFLCCSCRHSTLARSVSDNNPLFLLGSTNFMFSFSKKNKEQM